MGTGQSLPWGLMNEPILELHFDFPSMPAPRATRGSWWARGARYVEWRKQVRFFAARQTDGEYPFELPLQFPVAIQLEFIGTNPRSDIDNSIKAVMDALQGIILDGDHIAKVPAVGAHAVPCAEGQDPCFSIRIYRWEPLYAKFYSPHLAGDVN